MSESSNEQRTSLYLVRRAEALKSALEFFSGDGASKQWRRLQFLTQSDFWEWEIDNLIYSFTNLAERSKTWDSADAAGKRLGELGVVVNTKTVRDARWSGGWHLHRTGGRAAPVDLLREVIAVWNDLIDNAAKHAMSRTREKIEKYGVNARDPASMRKRMPDLEEVEQD